MALEPKVAAPTKLSLPVSVTGAVDIGRLLRELESIDNSLLQLGLRKGGTEVEMPKISHLMEKTLEHNKLNLLQPDDRTLLNQYLTLVREKAPVIHMSFSADPAPSFIEKLMVWLRKEINPNLLLTVGLQPNIGAGCIVRTTNKHFDFSLREDLIKKRDLLMSNLDEANQQHEAEVQQ